MHKPVETSEDDHQSKSDDGIVGISGKQNQKTLIRQGNRKPSTKF